MGSAISISPGTSLGRRSRGVPPSALATLSLSVTVSASTASTVPRGIDDKKDIEMKDTTPLTDLSGWVGQLVAKSAPAQLQDIGDCAAARALFSAMAKAVKGWLVEAPEGAHSAPRADWPHL